MGDSDLSGPPYRGPPPPEVHPTPTGYGGGGYPPPRSAPLFFHGPTVRSPMGGRPGPNRSAMEGASESGGGPGNRARGGAYVLHPNQSRETGRGGPRGTGYRPERGGYGPQGPERGGKPPATSRSPPDLLKTLVDIRTTSLDNLLSPAQVRIAEDPGNGSAPSLHADLAGCLFPNCLVGVGLLDALADYVPRGHSQELSIKMKTQNRLNDASTETSPNILWRQTGTYSNARGIPQGDERLGEWEAILDPPLPLHCLWDSLQSQLQAQVETERRTLGITASGDASSKEHLDAKSPVQTPSNAINTPLILRMVADPLHHCEYTLWASILGILIDQGIILTDSSTESADKNDSIRYFASDPKLLRPSAARRRSGSVSPADSGPDHKIDDDVTHIERRISEDNSAPLPSSLLDIYRGLHTYSIHRVATGKLQRLLNNGQWLERIVKSAARLAKDFRSHTVKPELAQKHVLRPRPRAPLPTESPAQAAPMSPRGPHQSMPRSELETLLEDLRPHRGARGDGTGNDEGTGTEGANDNEAEIGQNLRLLLAEGSFRDTTRRKAFRSESDRRSVSRVCTHGTRENCHSYHMSHNIPWQCSEIHFRKIISPHTDENLGDCSYLDTCRHMGSCRYVHYEVDQADVDRERQSTLAQSSSGGSGPDARSGTDSAMDELESRLISRSEFNAHGIDENATHHIGYVSEGIEMRPAQWINCDVLSFHWSQLIPKNLFKAIMLDPPWSIHMDLPYHLISDKNLLQLPIGGLQDDGLCFLWVTGRAMELGRDCLKTWGYDLVDELVWVKTNQLQRLVRTGRTGHWLNHCKEHCLIGVKGDISNYNVHLDTDVIVAEVRETSRKPDEIYRIIERLCPGPYKLEVFGRQHNVRNNWLTLGNQFADSHVHIPEIKDVYERIRAELPEQYIPNTYQKN